MTDNKGSILFAIFMSTWTLEQGIDITLADVCGRTDGGVNARVFWYLGGLMATFCVLMLVFTKKKPTEKLTKPSKPAAGIALFTSVIYGLVFILKAPRATLDITAPQVSWELRAAFCVIYVINFIAWALWNKETFRIWRISRTQSVKPA